MRQKHTTEPFFRSILDSLPQQIAVFDKLGSLVFVNRAWVSFCRENGGLHCSNWDGINYLETCSQALGSGDDTVSEILSGIEEVISGRSEYFLYEYPCHSPKEKRWFLMQLRPLELVDEELFVVTHLNITERRLAEDKIRQLSLVDDLTGLYNRRRFNAFLDEQWRRARRNRQPVSVILIDVDYFKSINDRFGHPAGDQCLRELAVLMENHCRRPDDLVARYGGEEFGIILGNTDLEIAHRIAEKIRVAVESTDMPFLAQSDERSFTISVGVACIDPRKSVSPDGLIEQADKCLYLAKEQGRNRVVSEISSDD